MPIDSFRFHEAGVHEPLAASRAALPRDRGFGCTKAQRAEVSSGMRFGQLPDLRSPETLLGFSGDFVSRLSNRPYGVSYGLLWELMGILSGLTNKSTDHPSRVVRPWFQSARIAPSGSNGTLPS